MAPPYLLFAGIGLTVVAVVLESVALDTPKWATDEARDSDDFVYYGLFKFCLPLVFSPTNPCPDYSTFKGAIIIPSSLHAVQALVIIGLLLVGAEIALAGLVFIFQYRKGLPKPFHLLALLAASGSALFTVVGCIVFRFITYENYDKLDGYDRDVDYSFILAIVGAAIAGGAGILIFLAGKMLNRQ